VAILESSEGWRRALSVCVVKEVGDARGIGFHDQVLFRVRSRVTAFSKRVVRSS
jgi:hypothetical protein